MLHDGCSQDTRSEGMPPARRPGRVRLMPSILRTQGPEAHFTDVTHEAQSVQMENSMLRLSQQQVLKTQWTKGRFYFFQLPSSDFKAFFNNSMKVVKVKGARSCLTFLRPRGLSSPWTSPGTNTGVGSLSISRGSSQPRDQTRSPTLWAGSLPAEPPGKPPRANSMHAFS